MPAALCAVATHEGLTTLAPRTLSTQHSAYQCAFIELLVMSLNKTAKQT